MRYMPEYPVMELEKMENEVDVNIQGFSCTSPVPLSDRVTAVLSGTIEAGERLVVPDCYTLARVRGGHYV